MNDQQITDFMLLMKGEVAALWESTKSAHHRINENDKITAGIHDLAKSIAEMATEVKLLTKRMDSSLERIEQGQKAQGARIGDIEKAILTISRNEKVIEEHEKRLDAIEREPSHDKTVEEHEKRLDAIEKAPAEKWNKFTWLIFAGVVTAVVAFLIGRFLSGV